MLDKKEISSNLVALKIRIIRWWGIDQDLYLNLVQKHLPNRVINLWIKKDTIKVMIETREIFKDKMKLIIKIWVSMQIKKFKRSTKKIYILQLNLKRSKKFKIKLIKKCRLFKIFKTHWIINKFHKLQM
jgi:hypothetical protein